MNNRKLRSGITTGTCAAAAAKASAVFVLYKNRVSKISVNLPNGSKKTVVVHQRDNAWFGVQKDSGDDPDITNGTWVEAEVTQVTKAEYMQLKHGYSETKKNCHLYIVGGKGIGIVTKKGLRCPVGYYAINPVPKEMIANSVFEVYEQYKEEIYLCVTISIPQGEELASKTFNPKLGIVGGISVLGTSGIVHPMSEDALIETIRIEVHMKSLEDQDILSIVPGNYGQDFLKKYKNLDMEESVKCSNFFHETAKILAEENVKTALFTGHIGKMIKVAGGVFNTHSKYGDRRMEIACEILTDMGYKNPEEIWLCNTMDEVLEKINDSKKQIEFLDEVAKRAKKHLHQWTGGNTMIEVITFSLEHKCLGYTAQAMEWIDIMTKRGNGNND